MSNIVLALGSSDVIIIPTEKGAYNTLDEATEAAILAYRNLTGDQTTNFIIMDSESITNFKNIQIYNMN